MKQGVFTSGIINGSITINDFDAIKNIIDDEPENVDLIAIYADLLLQKRLTELAWQNYKRASSLYLKNGHLLKSMMMSLAQWKIKKPSTAEIYNYFYKIVEYEIKPTKFYDFIKELSVAEKFAFLCKLRRENLPAKTIIKKVGEIENNLWFVLSGELRESFYELINTRNSKPWLPNRKISEEDLFGKIYPFNEQHKSTSYVETLTRVQTVVISKNCFRLLCLRYGNIEKALIGLCGIRKNETISKEIKLRRSYRYPVNVEMKIFIDSQLNESGQIYLTGYSKDISIHGVGFVVDRCSKETKNEISNILEKKAKISIIVIFYNPKIGITIPGSIVRLQESVENGSKTVVLGIEFIDLPPNIQGLIFSSTKILSNPEIINHTYD
jgi:CRP-like cAMP-binding protein